MFAVFFLYVVKLLIKPTIFLAYLLGNRHWQLVSKQWCVGSNVNSQVWRGYDHPAQSYGIF